MTCLCAIVFLKNLHVNNVKKCFPKNHVYATVDWQFQVNLLFLYLETLRKVLGTVKGIKLLIVMVRLVNQKIWFVKYVQK